MGYLWHGYRVRDSAASLHLGYEAIFLALTYRTMDGTFSDYVQGWPGSRTDVEDEGFYLEDSEPQRIMVPSNRPRRGVVPHQQMMRLVAPSPRMSQPIIQRPTTSQPIVPAAIQPITPNAPAAPQPITPSQCNCSINKQTLYLIALIVAVGLAAIVANNSYRMGILEAQLAYSRSMIARPDAIMSRPV